LEYVAAFYVPGLVAGRLWCLPGSQALSAELGPILGLKVEKPAQLEGCEDQAFIPESLTPKTKNARNHQRQTAGKRGVFR
jgi:hypothetical protein